MDYIVDQEWRIKHLKTEITLKLEEVRRLRIQTKELQEEANYLKSVIKEDRKERMEKQELFSETIS